MSMITTPGKYHANYVFFGMSELRDAGLDSFGHTAKCLSLLSGAVQKQYAKAATIYAKAAKVYREAAKVYAEAAKRIGDVGGQVWKRHSNLA